MNTSKPEPSRPRKFRSHPDPSEWDGFADFESTEWPRKARRKYWIIPSVCFNCESACGVIAYVDQETLEIRKIEGNPVHPGSRGRTCAKGVVTPNQLADPDRVLHPLKRAGARGEGKWQPVGWDEALDDIGGRIRRAILDGRRHELMYHVGRPGEDGYTNRVLQAWGIDGHNSHTNICSSSARLGHFLWTADDRPSPDYANAQTILLLSSHLETGHYFNPHAQRIMDAKAHGATLIAIDPRLSNSSAKADLWLPAHPGTEGALLLAIARWLLEHERYDREFVRRWVNWREYLAAARPDVEPTFDVFIDALKAEYAAFTPEYAEAETGVAAATIVAAAEAVARAGNRFATHSWRAAASGNLWGWQITRCLYLLVALTGSIGAVGGVNLHATNKFVPKAPNPPPAQGWWNELLFPREFPLAFHELSFLLPHFLKEGRGRIDVYVTRVYNPVWTNPDGFSWIEMLQDPDKIGLHVALTPTWSETAWFADYVLPMGLGTERHDTISQETHAGRWLGLRQPVLRVAREKRGERIDATHQANPGEVWEENEFWVATEDARRLGLATGDLVKVRTAIGHFVTRAWVTEGIRPGVLAMSHHLGRWRLQEELGGSRGASSLVTLSREGGRYRMRQVHGAAPFESTDPDSSRIWWREVGVHQNATFPVQPDPVSGMHCWHQRVRLEKAGPDDRYGDIMVDTERAHEVYREWMQRTRPAPGPGGLRRPLWFDRPLRPALQAYRIDEL